MELKQLMGVIQTLKELDGETMQWLLEISGQRDQMLKQLVLSAKPEEVEALVTQLRYLQLKQLKEQSSLSSHI
jgi:hypothetical protein